MLNNELSLDGGSVGCSSWHCSIGELLWLLLLIGAARSPPPVSPLLPSSKSSMEVNSMTISLPVISSRSRCILAAPTVASPRERKMYMSARGDDSVTQGSSRAGSDGAPLAMFVLCSVSPAAVA